MSRNELCACGSGKRYKHCHGGVQASTPGASRAAPRVKPPSALHLQAVSSHRAGSLEHAESLYREALRLDSADVESLQMLGVLYFERMRNDEALELLWDAAERTGWNDPVLLHNLGLVLARLMASTANARQEAMVAAFMKQDIARKVAPVVAGRVSVVLPVFNEARVVAGAIASVAAQTYRDIELFVIDDGSTDESATVIAQALADLEFPATFVRGQHRGAAQAANTGAARAAGRYLAFLAAADRFAPQRIERMVHEMGRAIALWGFSRFAELDNGNTVGRNTPRQGAPRRGADFSGDEPSSFALLKHDVTGASGNLFIDRQLFHELGGYRDDTQYRGWDFAIRAAQWVEPVAVGDTLYLCGRHNEAVARVRPSDADRRTALVTEALRGVPAVANELSPQFPGNRDLLLRAELRAGRAEHLPVAVLRSLAAGFRGQPSAPARPPRDAMTHGEHGKAALVVLGPYRSGTSALARVLNLCGAALPARVMPARLGLNPKGFWESEAVNVLDARLLTHLGGDWNRVDFALPRTGPLVDEFIADMRALLAAEYGAAPVILIKDPRVCVLAPLWHRGLSENGYRPTYVVPVRNPLEIAGSLESQGDMPVAEGLALWLNYMQRLETFVATVDAPVAYVRYAELLDDWRGVVQRIAGRLDLPLSIEAHASEVDEFLEPGMRRHLADDTGFDTQLARHLPDGRGEAIRILYQRSLEHCARDAANGPAARIRTT